MRVVFSSVSQRGISWLHILVQKVQFLHLSVPFLSRTIAYRQRQQCNREDVSRGDDWTGLLTPTCRCFGVKWGKCRHSDGKWLELGSLQHVPFIRHKRSWQAQCQRQPSTVTLALPTVKGWKQERKKMRKNPQNKASWWRKKQMPNTAWGCNVKIFTLSLGLAVLSCCDRLHAPSFYSQAMSANR